MPGAEHKLTELNREQTNWIKAHYHELDDLPEPGEPWTGKDTSLKYYEILELRNKGLIKRVWNGEREGSGSSYRYYYTPTETYDALETFKELSEKSDSVFPCGHNAIKNERGVDGITCGVCGSVYDKSEVSA